MGRSVMIPCNAIATAYFPWGVGDVCGAEDNWEDEIDNLRCVLKDRFASLSNEDGWLGDEERIILQNDHGQVIVCEYCGLVSVSIVPRDMYYYDSSLEELRDYWCRQVADSFIQCLNKAFGGLRLIGSASNGESFYETV